jgi:signal transduction histidine kinase
VITAPIYSGFFLQDGTWAIFVRWEGLRLSDRPRTGDYWEIEGTSYAEFSPNIQASSAVRLGTSVLPEPLHPAPDQFFNGSLDTRYIEIQGVVTSSESNNLEMIIPEGRIKVQLSDIDPSLENPIDYNLKRYENARIRVRGCAIPSRDEKTQQVQLGYLWIWLCNFSITVDHPAPVDPFSAPLKNISELRQFNPNASLLQSVKVAGQIIHERSGEFFLWDGSQALRFIPRTPVQLIAGDRVEVAGFPDFGGASIVLREAVVRNTGHAALPAPRVLTNGFLLNQSYDGTLVRLRAKLTDISTESADQILTLQAGAHGIIARLNARKGSREDLLPGSLLELSGVYVAKGPDVPSFDLLLNSPEDITVLARPDWWTLRRLLAAFGLIVVVLAGAMLWIFTLRRRVKKQTLIIRQKVEREATMEERGRIARDIHDTLEQALAGTSLQLNALSDALPNVSPEPLRVLKVARSMVHHAQEEARRTVMNLRFLDLEKHDLPAALKDLATQSGNESPVEMQVNVKGTRRPLSSKVESHLLRIAQESITNAIKHAQAKSARVELNYDPACLLLTVQDDGCGFNADSAVPAAVGHFGLLGMRERAEKIGGTLQILSSPGQGTTVEVRVPCPQPNSALIHDRPPAT